jgi:hypothetical protein
MQSVAKMPKVKQPSLSDTDLAAWLSIRYLIEILFMHTSNTYSKFMNKVLNPLS